MEVVFYEKLLVYEYLLEPANYEEQLPVISGFYY